MNDIKSQPLGLQLAEASTDYTPEKPSVQVLIGGIEVSIEGFPMGTTGTADDGNDV